MIFGEDCIERLLSGALRESALSRSYGVVIEGSIAEGFGNDSSDVDFVVLVDDDLAVPVVPTILFVDGHRVEIRFRTVASVRADARLLASLSIAKARRVGGVPSETLDRLQRFSHAHAVRNVALVQDLQGLYDRKHLATVIAAWHEAAAIRAARNATILGHLRQHAEALWWARSGVVSAAKAWAARAAETYVPRKWLSLQLTRAGMPPSVADTVWRACHGAPSSAAAGVDACFAALTALGVGVRRGRPSDLRLTRRRSVTTWQVGGRVYVVRGRRDIFLLSHGAGRIWRSLVFGVPIGEAVPASAPHDGVFELVTRFHRLGFIGLAWRGTKRAWVREEGLPPDHPSGPILCPADVDGAGRTAVDIRFIPMPARRFVTAAGEMVWSQILLESYREDLTGARRQHQWKVLSDALGRMVAQACQAVLSAHGVEPLPAPEEVVPRTQDVIALPLDLRRELDRVVRLEIDGEDDADQAVSAVTALVTDMQAILHGSAVPASFKSAANWRRTVEVAYEWARLGAYVGARFPVARGRDLLRSPGQ
jgi:hypothetical protein